MTGRDLPFTQGDSLRRHVSVLLAFVFSVLGLVVVPTAAQAEGGLTGTVTSTSGEPASACVSVYDLDYNYVAGTCTEPDGSWAIPDLADGVYKVSIEAFDGYLSEWAHDASDFESAVEIAAPGVVDTQLERASTLTGTLTDSTGSPVEWANVTATGVETDTEVASTSTSSDGTWSLAVPAGSYKVRMDKWPAVVWAFGADSHATASVVTVGTGETTQVNDSFPQAATVTGTITDARTHRPIPGACAQLTSLDGYGTDGFGSACADDAGRYTIEAWATGPMLVLFTDPEGRYAAEYSGNTTNLKRAKPVTVNAGTTTVSAALEPGARLSGRVVSSVDGLGIENVCPSAHGARSWSWLPGTVRTCSDTSGTYTLAGLPSDPISVLLTPQWHSGLAQTWYFGATDVTQATVLRPRAGQTLNLKDTVLAPAGRVTGIVTDPAGNPLPDVLVNLEGNYGGRVGGCDGQLCGRTDEFGRYEILAPPGTYRPIFWTYEGHWAPEWSGDATTKQSATPVTVVSSADTTLDAQLASGATIEGAVVTATGGLPTQYALGLVFTEAGDYIGDFDAYAGSGWTFHSSALPAGSFRLKIQLYDEATGTSTDSWYDGSTTPEGATLVPLSQGEVASIVYHLP